jgi:hypothetical protein
MIDADGIWPDGTGRPVFKRRDNESDDEFFNRVVPESTYRAPPPIPEEHVPPPQTANARVGWKGVDLDGTIAEYNRGDYAKFGWNYIGPPIEKMVTRVKKWLAEGTEVRIMTARVCGDFADPEVKKAIQDWCLKHIGTILPVTNKKDYDMIELWDDRAIQIISNTGLRADGVED